MAERTASLYEVAGPGAADQSVKPDDRNRDLDWEFQRLLAEEIAAMEPGPAPTPTGAPTTQSSSREGSLTLPPPAAAPQLEGLAGEQGDAQAAAMASQMAQTLSGEIDLLYQKMSSEVGARRQSFDAVADLLQGARMALLAGPASISLAEKLIKQATGLLNTREESRRWSSTYGAMILGYEFLCFLALAAVLAFDRPLAAWAGALTHIPSAASMRDILPFWDTMMWGGIGGVVGALYSLYWHVAEQQDFDRQFNMWYVVQPIMGAILGAFIFLIVASGLFAMHSTLPTAPAWFPSALACLCGFRQKFIFELLDKLVEVIGLRPILSKVGKSSKEP